MTGKGESARVQTANLFGKMQMPIPQKEKIKEAHIRQAIERIDREKYDPMYESYRYVVEINGKEYPPKHVVRLANMIANGGKLDELTFYPSEAIRLLKRFNFMIREKVRRAEERQPPKVKISPQSQPPGSIDRDKRVNDILFQLEQILKKKRLLAPGTDLYGYINELSRQGDVPSRIAGLMHAIRRMRNEFTKKRVELTDAEFAALEANWSAIQEWAQKYKSI
jgi:hypothetical protein